MAKFTPQSLAPRYMQVFQCIGSECEETCCNGWQVHIDKRTFQKYRSVKIEPIAGLLHKHIVRSENPAAEGFAHIALTPEGNCPLLDTARLCRVQGSLGADHLSDTCNHYPRAFLRDAEVISTYASLSCPQAARLALLDPQGMDLGQMPLAFPNASVIPFAATRAVPVPGRSDPIQVHAQLIRDCLATIVRYPGLTAAQALLVCGIIVRRLAEQIRSAPDAAAAEAVVIPTLTRFMDAAALERSRQLIDELQTPQAARITLLKEVTAMYVQEVAGRLSFRTRIADAMEGLGHGQTDDAGMQERYSAAEREWFAPFDAAHPHILKNYLLNDLGKSLFPAGTVQNIEADLMNLTVRFALIKLYLIGQAAKHREAFGEADCVGTIYTFVRNIEHNPKFLPQVMQLMADKGFVNLATLATLVR
jgi:lysine-N-methylase